MILHAGFPHRAEHYGTLLHVLYEAYSQGQGHRCHRGSTVSSSESAAMGTCNLNPATHPGCVCISTIRCYRCPVAGTALFLAAEVGRVSKAFLKLDIFQSLKQVLVRSVVVASWRTVLFSQMGDVLLCQLLLSFRAA